MISLKNKQKENKQKGFTIVELLIVIVVIGILAAIVIVTFTGVQKKARDADRKSDVNGIAAQAEVYYGQEAKYPTLTELQTPLFRTNNLKGLSEDAITAPGGTVDADGTLVASGAATGNYQYVAEADGGGVCDNAATPCEEFTLTATLEGGGTFEKKGSNN